MRLAQTLTLTPEAVALSPLPGEDASARNRPESSGLPVTRPARAHRADIDGLRAVAVLAVIGFHTHCLGFSGGYVGVDVFFVISGYLICSILLRELEDGTFRFAKFYERRCKRILPALIFVLLFCLGAGLFLLSPAEEAQLGRGAMATIASVSNIQFYFLSGYFNHEGLFNPLLMTWSLAVEEQFYLVFPLLLLAVHRYARRHIFSVLLLGCALSFLLSVYSEFRHPEFNFFLPFTRAWELGAGTLLAVWQAKKLPRSVAAPRWRTEVAGACGMLLILGCILFYSPATRFPGFEAAPPVLGAILLLMAPGSLANRALEWTPFRAVGQVSYSLYLWHWPVLSFAAIAVDGDPSPRARVFLMLFAAGGAVLSFFAVETPFRARASSSVRNILLAYASVSLTLFALAYFVTRTDGFARRSPALAFREQSLSVQRPHECIISPDHDPLLTPVCFPAASAAPAAALLGDSHAEAVSETLRDALSARGEKLLILTSYSCPPLVGYTRLVPEKPQYADTCARFNAKALTLVLQRSDVKTVYLLGDWPMLPDDFFVPVGTAVASNPVPLPESERNLVLGLAAEVKMLEAAGKQVVILDDWPSLPFSPMAGMKASHLPARRLLADAVLGQPIASVAPERVARSEVVSPWAEKVTADLLDLAKSDSHLRVIDTKSLFCPNRTCLVSSDGSLLYVDPNHASHFGAERIVRALP